MLIFEGVVQMEQQSIPKKSFNQNLRNINSK